jgi:tetratricopeptide (TPR) repeat protein
MLLSCDDAGFLEETPKDFLAPENAYASVAGIKQGITGLHYTVRYDWFSPGNDDLQDVYSIYKGLGTDIAFHGEDPGSTRFLCNYQTYLIPTSSYVEEYWKRPFILIQKVNMLVQFIDASDDAIWSSPAQKLAYRAEALFFRAFAYRHLVSFFGDVPVMEDIISSAKTDFVRDPVSKAYELMERDLKEAAQNLPDPGKEEDPGRITKGAALHLLTEVYLMQKKYSDAVASATQVIDNFGYRLMTERFGSTVDVFGTGDVYLDLFAYGNQNLAENKEAIWVVQFEPPTVTGGGNVRSGRAFGPAYFRMGNTPDGKIAFRGEFVNGAYTGYSDTLGRGVAWIHPSLLMTHTAWIDNWDNDIRNAPHSIKRDFYFDNPESAYHGKKINFDDYPATAGRDRMRDTCQYIYPLFLKMADPCNILDNPAQSGGGGVFKDQYGMRLAETYLYRAEAYVGLGQNDLAAADINKIRERSNAKPITAAQADLDYVLDERARELYGETCRHFVLRRTGKLLERVRKYNNNPRFPGLNIQDYNVLWPIPQSQIDLNIDVPFPQNPGY